MRRVIIMLALTCGVLSGPVEDEYLQEFVTGNHRFTAAVYKELIKKSTGNIIVSPLSVETVLALTNEGARGQTATEVVAGLSLPNSIEKTQKAFQSLLPKLKKSDDDIKLLSANKIYAGKNVKLEKGFKDIASRIYESSVENVDFAQNVEAAQAINSWVEDHTNHKIKNLMDPSTISNDTKIVLVNALYFSGKWVSWFENYATKKRKFFNSKENSVDVDTMYQLEYLDYYENPILDAKFLELLYEGDDISMVIVLPNKIDGLAKLEENFEQVLQPQPFTNERVEVSLPKFTIETEIEFVPILKNLGIQNAFSDKADFSGISSTHKNLFVSDVVQKAFINVTEAGTEAGAATEEKLVELSLDHTKPIIFKVDHPFLFYITYKNVILFTGRITSV